MLVRKDSLRRVVAMCKAEGKRVVIGGPYATTSAEHLPEADHIFLSEAETTLPKFVRDLESGAPKRVYQAAERPAHSAAPIPDFHNIAQQFIPGWPIINKCLQDRTSCGDQE
jgi:radical SAM superfamily enzyme YgiQ (UPF0313 family)